MNFEDFVAKLGLRHFEAHELLRHTDRERNEEPPPEMWNNIVPTILILDELRECLGVPIILTSVHRHPDYNATIDGAAPRSLHQAFAAVDIRIPALDARGVSLRTVYELLRLWQDQWFATPVPIETSPSETLDGSTTPHENLNVRERNGILEFRFRGYIFYGGSYIHIDTRGTNDSED